MKLRKLVVLFLCELRVRQCDGRAVLFAVAELLVNSAGEYVVIMRSQVAVCVCMCVCLSVML